MSFNHAVIWLDHQEAHVIHFNPTASESETIRTHSTHPHNGHAHGKTEQRYLHDVIHAVADAREVLIVGPGSAKTELVKHVARHDHALSDKIVGVETVDHPSDAQLLAYAKKYFIKVDNMKGDAPIH